MRLARPLPLLAFALALVLASAPAGARAGDLPALPAYLSAKDDSFAWEAAKEYSAPGATVTAIRLTSQTWQGIAWKHWLMVIVPEERDHAKDALLVIGGGRNRDNPPDELSGETLLLLGQAVKTGTVVAVLSQVPNQPLFENLREDALIAFTFQKFIETKDETWPCLLPMTRSAIRAMDAVQAFTAKDGGQKVERFFVTGASKRGWTTWLTAAADRRVCAIAPMVIDVLNMPKQMPHQLEMLGAYSEQIRDYTRLGLPQKVSDAEAKQLLDLVDPYTFRDRLTMPKLIVLGTNDPYWAVDAINLYFPDLPGEKYIHYVPNAGHGLGPSALEAVSAFYKTVLDGEARPRFSWRFAADAEAGTFTIESADAPKQVELWTAASPDKDFRNDRWSGVPVQQAGEGRYVVRVPRPAEGFAAAHVALTFTSSLGHDYKLCTNVEVFGATPAPPAKKGGEGKKGKLFSRVGE